MAKCLPFRYTPRRVVLRDGSFLCPKINLDDIISANCRRDIGVLDEDNHPDITLDFCNVIMDNPDKVKELQEEMARRERYFN